MANKEGYISDFGNFTGNVESSDLIDFSSAQKLDTTGSTCDAYVLYHRDRKVFVKRLKEEFRTSPRHLKAFKKEYTIGLTLSHSSLPTYYELGSDYIAMNYIDGQTLSELMAINDRWLKDGQNVLKVLSQVLDAVDYLHRKNLIHCDIKIDNIIVTHEGHNAMLIDLDKAYASWNDKTPGSAVLYGKEESEKRSESNDFACLALLAGKLESFVSSSGVRKTLIDFAKACGKEDVSIAELKEILKAGEEKKNKTSYIVAAIIVSALVIVGILILLSPSGLNQTMASNNINNTQKDTVVVNIPVKEESKIITIENSKTNNNQVSSSSINLESFNNELKAHFEPFEIYLDKVSIDLDTGSLNQDEMLDAVYQMTGQFSELTQKAYSKMEAEYPDMNATDIQLKVGNSQAYRNIVSKMDKCSRKVAERLNGSQSVENLD